MKNTVAGTMKRRFAREQRLELLERCDSVPVDDVRLFVGRELVRGLGGVAPERRDVGRRSRNGRKVRVNRRWYACHCSGISTELAISLTASRTFSSAAVSPLAARRT